MIPYKSFIRNFSFNVVLYKSRDGRFMSKIMQSSTISKKKWFNSSNNTPAPLFSATSLSKGANEGKHSSNLKRVTVLNKVFMRYITDLMATGENSAEYLGRGIEINRVMVTPDFKGINIFWIAKGTEDDDQLEELLKRNSGSLRHELSQLRVMGVVPKINFVKDKQYAKLMEVDLKLAKADFGEDYVPVDPSYKLKTQLSLNTQLPPHIKEKIEALESEENEDFNDPPLPPMRMDVLGLNHAVIMHRVQQQKKKSQALHRKKSETKENVSITTNENPLQFDSQHEQNEAFRQFLVKRQILKAKAGRSNNKKNLEKEYLCTLEENETFNDYTLMDKFVNNDEDYIEEIEDNVKL